MTTSYRSALYLRKQGMLAEVVEHRMGSFVRKDLFNCADVLALPPPARFSVEQEPLVLVQAYLDTKQNRLKHAHIDGSHGAVERWKMAGGRFVHHLWHKKRGRWNVKVKEV